MTFHVGQKVVCIRAKDLLAREYSTLPVEGRIYTIRKVIPPLAPDDREDGLCVEGITGRQSCWGVEWSFNASRFRPIVEKKTDISIFTAMLNTSKQGVDA